VKNLSKNPPSRCGSGSLETVGQKSSFKTTLSGGLCTINLINSVPAKKKEVSVRTCVGFSRLGGIFLAKIG